MPLFNPFEPQEPPSSLEEELSYLLSPMGLQLPPRKQNVVLPEPGTPNFFGRHPRLAGAIESGLMAAATTPSSQTIGEGISNVAGSLLRVPQMRQQMQIDALIAPLQMAGQVGNLRKLRNDQQLTTSRIANENAQTELYKAQTKAAQDKPTHLSIKLTPAQAQQIGIPQLADQILPFSDVKEFFKEHDPKTDVVHANGRVQLINKTTGNVIKDLGNITYKPESERKPEYRASLRMAEQQKHQALEKAEKDFRDPQAGFDGLPNYAFNNQEELLRRKQSAQQAYEEQVTALTGNDVTGNYNYETATPTTTPTRKPELTLHPDGRIIIK